MLNLNGAVQPQKSAKDAKTEAFALDLRHHQFGETQSCPWPLFLWLLRFFAAIQLPFLG